MLFTLSPHPQHRGRAVSSVTASVVRESADRLNLRFCVIGAMRDVVWPAPMSPGRSDDLWKHSCFEAFIRIGEGAGYREINLSPSHRWATYAFDRYRAGMREAEELEVPAIAWAASDTGAALAASVIVGGMAGGWRLGLSAIIEERGGDKSYWALRHPAGRPDFHAADCFAAVCAAPSAA